MYVSQTKSYLIHSSTHPFAFGVDSVEAGLTKMTSWNVLLVPSKSNNIEMVQQIGWKNLNRNPTVQKIGVDSVEAGGGPTNMRRRRRRGDQLHLIPIRGYRQASEMPQVCRQACSSHCNLDFKNRETAMLFTGLRKYSKGGWSSDKFCGKFVT